MGLGPEKDLMAKLTVTGVSEFPLQFVYPMTEFKTSTAADECIHKDTTFAPPGVQIQTLLGPSVLTTNKS